MWSAGTILCKKMCVETLQNGEAKSGGVPGGASFYCYFLLPPSGISFHGSAVSYSKEIRLLYFIYFARFTSLYPEAA